MFIASLVIGFVCLLDAEQVSEIATTIVQPLVKVAESIDSGNIVPKIADKASPDEATVADSKVADIPEVKDEVIVADIEATINELPAPVTTEVVTTEEEADTEVPAAVVETEVLKIETAVLEVAIDIVEEPVVATTNDAAAAENRSAEAVTEPSVETVVLPLEIPEAPASTPAVIVAEIVEAVTIEEVIETVDVEIEESIEAIPAAASSANDDDAQLPADLADSWSSLSNHTRATIMMLVNADQLTR